MGDVVSIETGRKTASQKMRKVGKFEGRLTKEITEDLVNLYTDMLQRQTEIECLVQEHKEVQEAYADLLASSIDNIGGDSSAVDDATREVMVSPDGQVWSVRFDRIEEFHKLIKQASQE